MTTGTTSHIRRAYRRVKRAWSELEYAQRRLFELRTGVAVTGPKRTSSRDRATIDKLERLYALDSPVQNQF
jgi:hypothetical protein